MYNVQCTLCSIYYTVSIIHGAYTEYNYYAKRFPYTICSVHFSIYIGYFWYKLRHRKYRIRVVAKYPLRNIYQIFIWSWPRTKSEAVILYLRDTNVAWGKIYAGDDDNDDDDDDDDDGGSCGMAKW